MPGYYNYRRIFFKIMISAVMVHSSFLWPLLLDVPVFPRKTNHPPTRPDKLRAPVQAQISFQINPARVQCSMKSAVYRLIPVDHTELIELMKAIQTVPAQSNLFLCNFLATLISAVLLRFDAKAAQLKKYSVIICNRVKSFC